MKTVLSLLVCLVLILNYTFGCDPHSDGKPLCTSTNLSTPQRNFWDPTRYWKCVSANTEPENVRCNETLLFSSEKAECVLWNAWVWTPPCPEQS
uniref:Chitin-binding type-2 domain-containing protein n=1 Tax=Glossina austeni TaxID=7395 RepID=A0A1A9ULY5_GLOAU